MVKMILKCMRYITKENLLFLRDLLELLKLKSTNTWLQYQRMCIYNHTYHRAIKMKPLDVKDNTYINTIELRSSKEVSDKVLNLMLVIM